MAVLKTYINGEWKEVSGLSEHTHTVDDITNFPSSLPDGVIFYNHVSEITYEIETTEDEILPDVDETYANLFDKDTMIAQGWMYRGATSISGANANALHAIVPIVGGKTYSYHRSNVTYSIKNEQITVEGSIAPNLADLCFFDANGNYLYGILNVNTFMTFKGPNFTEYTGEETCELDLAGKGLTFTTREDVAAVKFNIYQSGGTYETDEDTIVLEEGNICHDDMDYGATSNSGIVEEPNGNLEGYEITGLFGASIADTYVRRNLSEIAGNVDKKAQVQIITWEDDD